jgi:hypothetical protein
MYADTNADALDVNPASAQFYINVKNQLKKCGFENFVLYCDAQN